MNTLHRGLAVAAALVFGSFGAPAFSQTAKSSQQPTNVYPPEVVQGFMNGCVEEGEGTELEPLCACAIEQFQNNYTLEEFLVFASQIGEEEDIPEEVMPVFMEIFSSCVAYYPSEGEQAAR